MCLTLDLFVDVLSADVDVNGISSERSAGQCRSQVFSVRSLAGHNGIVTALAMSDHVLVTARCAGFYMLHQLVFIDM